MTLIPKAYEVLSRAVDDGLQHGVTRLFKHESAPLSEHDLREKIDVLHTALMTEIIEWFDIPEPKEPE